MLIPLVSISILLIVTLIILIVTWRKKSKQIKILSSDLSKYSGIISIEKEIETKNKEFSELQENAKNLNDKFINAKKVYMKLEKDLNLYSNELEFIDLGIYQPIFDFDTSEEFKQKLTDIILLQKQCINFGDACVCNTPWRVGESRAKGQVMVKRLINLSLRAFNGECAALISKVKWNNVNRFEERIIRAFNAINKLGKSSDIQITEQYLKLKIKELHLTHELALKKYEEKEEQKRIRAEQREEERALREIEKAKKEAEMEEKRFKKALEKAQKQLGIASGDQLEKLNKQIEDLKQNLQEANKAKERAISRAQQTRSGHVYIISNLGSFGEGVYKIGMTRRLEPMDRVKELGDASVPFKFDTHAMIYSEDAPALENLLHKEFRDRRINKVNFRKEYFQVTLEEIEKVVRESFEKEVTFIKTAEAQEYRETKYLIQEKLRQEGIKEEVEADKFPDSLF